MKRILDCGAADFRMIKSGELLEAIRLSEGRTLMCEALWPAAPLADGVSNAQLAVAFGADLVLLNMFSGAGLAGLKERLGRPVGVNVEPSEDVPGHRRASRDNLRRLENADFIIVTANPDARAGTEEMVSAVALVRETLPGVLVIAGKMHGSGGRGLVEPEEMARLADVVDAVLVPAPGTIPGSRESTVSELVDAAHVEGSLAVATIGTSQEGADPETVRALALAAKRAGADVLHLGDTGVSGIAEPMNILTASFAVRGRRHTYRRMAMR
ncbi:MAG: haloacid dehalogenase-like hydrolase [Actinomycetota bacterium]|nr:haloacid dehalogenase-like hydrolase [Actinomycetota bacterium]